MDFICTAYQISALTSLQLTLIISGDSSHLCGSVYCDAISGSYLFAAGSGNCDRACCFIHAGQTTNIFLTTDRS